MCSTVATAASLASVCAATRTTKLATAILASTVCAAAAHLTARGATNGPF